MKKVLVLLIAMSVGAVVAFTARDADCENSQIFGGKLPAGYRDWKLISVAHEAGKLNDLRAILGTTQPLRRIGRGSCHFQMARSSLEFAWNYVSSEENNKVFGDNQSFVAGAPTNVQFMVKDSKQYASTGGWGFAQFNDGKPANIVANDCYLCHVPVKDRDFLFTRYAP